MNKLWKIRNCSSIALGLVISTSLLFSGCASTTSSEYEFNREFEDYRNTTGKYTERGNSSSTQHYSIENILFFVTSLYLSVKAVERSRDRLDNQ